MAGSADASCVKGKMIRIERESVRITLALWMLADVDRATLIIDEFCWLLRNETRFLNDMIK